MPFTLAISKERTPFIKNYWLQGCILIFCVVWANSFVGTTDRANWFLENTLTFIFVAFLLLTYRNAQQVLLELDEIGPLVPIGLRASRHDIRRQI